MIGAKLLILCTSFPSLFLFYNLSLLALFIRNQSLSLLALLFVSYFTYWKFFAFNSHEEIQIQENKSRKFTSLHGEQVNIWLHFKLVFMSLNLMAVSSYKHKPTYHTWWYFFSLLALPLSFHFKEHVGGHWHEVKVEQIRVKRSSTTRIPTARLAGNW